jgi:NAD+ kinase
VKVALYHNHRNPRAAEVALSAAKSLKVAGADVIFVETPLKGADATPLEKLEGSGPGIMVAVGGDGTILRALQRYSGPVLGINAGVLGFLTEVGPDEADKAVARLMAGDYILDERMKLMCTKAQERLLDCTNECVLHTSKVAKMRSFDIRVRGEKLDPVRADGIIIATPTGSTSYALSAGGPVVHPSMDAIVIVPLAPFSLTAEPIVVPGNSVVEITPRDKGRTAVLVLDGQEEVDVSGGEFVTISRSERRARFVRFSQRFFERLGRRLETE